MTMLPLLSGLRCPGHNARNFPRMHFWSTYSAAGVFLNRGERTMTKTKIPALVELLLYQRKKKIIRTINA